MSIIFNPTNPHQGQFGPKPTAPPNTGTNTALLTTSGGLYGYDNVLLVPFYNAINGFSYFLNYDPANFNSEVDCVYYFRLESVKPGRAIDVHKVYFEYRDLGAVKFTTTVTATQYDRATKRETEQSKSVISSMGKGDRKIHTLFVDLKVVGERPQLMLLRKANAGPLAIIRAMLIGNVVEEDQL